MRKLFRQSLLLASANLRTRYRKTYAGLLWVVISPILIFLVQGLIFKNVLKLDMSNYPLFLLLGLLPWLFLNSSIEMTVGLIFYQGRLLKSFPVHPLSLIVAQVMDSFLNFIISFVVLLFAVSCLSSSIPSQLVYLVFAIFPLLLFVIGLSFSLSILQVFLHDVKFVTGFVLNILFFLTPIFYPEQMVPENLKFLIHWNPLVYIFRPFQILIGPVQSEAYIPVFGVALVFGLAMFAVGILIWKGARNAIYFKI